MRINNPIQPVLPNISSYIHRLLKHWWQPTDMNKHEKQPADGLHPTPVHAADKRCDRSRSWISSKENKSVIANFSSSGQADRHEHHTKRYCPSGISPMENSDCLPRGKPAATESRYPTFGACWVFVCFHNPPNSDRDYRIFKCAQMLVHAVAHGGVRTP